jgi:hypothetical protein
MNLAADAQRDERRIEVADMVARQNPGALPQNRLGPQRMNFDKWRDRHFYKKSREVINEAPDRPEPGSLSEIRPFS